MILRPYQTECVEQVLAAYAGGKNAPVIVAATGSGKTICIGEVIRRVNIKGTSAIVMAHRTELIDQLYEKVRATGVRAGVIKSGDKREDRSARVQVASVQTLVNRLKPSGIDGIEKWKPRCDLLIIDECFPAGTLVDGIAIEAVNVGDFVSCYNELMGRIERRLVANTFKSRPSKLVSVHMDDGSKIACTAGHPFYTSGEWVQAINLKKGDQLYVAENSSVQNLLCANVSGKGGLSKTGTELRFLFDRVPRDSARGGSEKNVRDRFQYEPEICVREDEESESDEQARCAREGNCVSREDRPQAKHSRRQWDRTDRRRGGFVGSNWSEDQFGRCLQDGSPQRVPYLLQIGHGGSVDTAWSGSGRKQPLPTFPPSAGQEERGISAGARVDRIEIHEQTSDGTFGGLCPDGFVYNIEVEGNHNYFAEGILVHNCHHVRLGNSYDKILKAYHGVKSLGCTATPERTDGAGLGDLFDEMILVSSPAELMLEGFLCQYEVYESPMKLDFSGAKRIRGELDEKAVSIIVDKPKVIGNVFETWMRHAQGKPTLVFARNRQHGEHLRDVFVQGGITCKYVDDATSAHDRAKAIEDYKARRVTVLVNIGLFTEGTDLPLTECIQMTWQTMSLIKYLQMAGRGLRPSPGKSHLTILDHGNNVRLHGLPDDPREWSLEGRKKRPTAKITSVATCPMCFHLFAARTRECPKCGFQVIAAGDPLPDFVDVELVKRALPTPAERKQAATLELDSQRTVLNDLMAERAMMNKGWKWPLVEYRKRFGKFPREKHGVKVDYQRGRNGYEISAWYLDGRRVGGIAPAPAPVSDEELFA